MAQQPIRVVVEHKKSGGCGTVLLVLILIGLAIKYWYIALGIAVFIAGVAAIASEQQREKQRAAQRNRTGPRDPWLNEVAVALADLGLTEIERNTGHQLGGVPIEGDIGLEDERLRVYVTLFSDEEQARQAELALRAKPQTREMIAHGTYVLKAAGRVLFTANGRGGVADDFRVDEIVQVVGKIAPPPPLQAPRPVRNPQGLPSVPATPADSSGALEQLRKLGELRDAGVLSQAEFEAKKAELLERI